MKGLPLNLKGQMPTHASQSEWRYTIPAGNGGLAEDLNFGSVRAVLTDKQYQAFQKSAA